MKDYFFHDGTKYILDGNKTLAMSHFHEIRAHLHQLKRVNVNELEVVTGQKIFDDGTEAHYQLIHGIEKIEVFAPPPPQPEEEPEKEERFPSIVPCLVITGTERYSTDIIGYIACLSGTFKGPYIYFANDDEEAVLEGFYAEGAEEYSEEAAFKPMHRLSGNGIDDLLFFKPSGTAPAEDRVSEGEYMSSGSVPSSWGPVSVIDGGDTTWLWVTKVATQTTSGTTTAMWDLLFDDTVINVAYSENKSSHRTDEVTTAHASCEVGQECQQYLQDFRSQSHPPPGVNWKYAFYSSGSTELVTGEFLDNWVNAVARLNVDINNAVYLTTESRGTNNYSAWNRVPPPTPYENRTVSSACDGCTTSSSTWEQELFITLDNQKISVTAGFDWEKIRGYDATVAGCGTVYHKKEGEPSALATVLSGPTDGKGYGLEITDMAFICLRPGVEGLDGSISLPCESDSIDRFCLPSQFNFDNVEGKIRGHVFFGVINPSY